MKRQSPGFWAGGTAEYSKVLRAQRDEQLEPFQAQLDQAVDPDEIARLEAAMDQVNRRYQEEEKKIGGYLF